MSTTDYQEYMVYELDDSGERVKLDGVTIDSLESLLHPEQVLVIVHEQIRRIFIWKGAKSPVRKRFISSRVASQLQEELVKVAAFHRCKIVSIDQGDELKEFLNAFGLESMPVEDRMEDLRYVRNIEKQGGFGGKVIEDKKAKPAIPKKEVVKTAEKAEAPQKAPKTKATKAKSKPKKEPKPAPKITRTVEKSPLAASIGQTTTISHQPTASPTHDVVSLPVSVLGEKEIKEIKEKILKAEPPKNFKRQNLIIGHSLYGAVAKKVKVLGKAIEETDWEKVTSLPKGMIEIQSPMIRAYFNDKGTKVEAIEILEKADGTESKETAVKSEEKKPNTRRKLPKIPSDKD